MPKKTITKITDNQCRLKVRYETQLEADVAAKEVEMKNGDEMHTYKCKLCGGYHNRRKDRVGVRR